MQAEVSELPLPSAAEAYDTFSRSYDSTFNSALAYAENQAVFRKLVEWRYLSGRVLDAGCGTGLLLDWCGDWLPASCYQGFDISEGMIKEAIRKHAGYNFSVDDMASDFRPCQRFDSIVSLFASPSYVDLPAFLRRAHTLLNAGGKIAVMPFGNGERFHTDYRVRDNSDNEVPHKNWQSRELSYALEEAGFAVEQVTGYTSASFHAQHSKRRSYLLFDETVQAYATDYRHLQLDTSEANFILGLAVKES